MSRIKNAIYRAYRYIIRGIPNNVVKANITQMQPNELLRNRNALITGGTSGIGLEIAKAFLNAGADIIIFGRSGEKIDKVISEIKEEQNNCANGGGQIIGIQCDIKNVSSLESKFQEAICKSGKRIDILVNCAGIQGGRFGYEEEESFDNAIDTNLKGTYFLSQIVAHYMKDNGIEGNILNIASSSSLRPAASSYTLSKWGIRGLTIGMGKVLAPYGIVVNGLAPGPTATPMLHKNGSDDNLYRADSPIGRFATSEEVANMAVILVSNMSRTIIGDIIYMTGGGGITTFDDIYYKF